MRKTLYSLRLLIAAILAAMSFVAPAQAAIQRSVDASAAARIFASAIQPAIERAADYSRPLRIFAPDAIHRAPPARVFSDEAGVDYLPPRCIAEAVRPAEERSSSLFRNPGLTDNANRRIKTTDPAGITQFAYDNNGNLTQVSDPRGKVTTHVYDNAN